jgi:regulator of replication initiation timing
MEAQIELADAVSKLAEKLVAAQAQNAHKESHKSAKLSDVTEKLQLSVQEVDDLKLQRLALERRVESMKTAARTAREESAVLTVEIDTLKARVEEVSAELVAAKQRVLVSSDNTSSEIQVLEEENIELMAENKDLRAKLAKARVTAPAATAAVVSAPVTAAAVPVASENTAPHSPVPVVQKKQSGTPSVGQKRAFGTDVTNTMSAKKSAAVDSKVNKPVVSLSALVTGIEGDATQGRKKVAKPIVAAAEENPAECTQS